MALLASKVKIVCLSQERRQLTVFMRKWFSEKYYVALALTWLCVHSCKAGLVWVWISTSFMWIENILSFICITQRLSHSMFDAQSTHAVIWLNRNRSALPYAVLPHSSITHQRLEWTLHLQNTFSSTLVPAKRGSLILRLAIGVFRSCFGKELRIRIKRAISINKCPR
jgi:hypothetical protein